MRKDVKGYWQEWLVNRHMIRNVYIILLTYLCKMYRTIMIRNYNAYLILVLFGHDGHCITIANVSLQFKIYFFNINTIFNTMFTYFSMFNINKNNSHKHHHYSSYSNITQYYYNFLSISLLS